MTNQCLLTEEAIFCHETTQAKSKILNYKSNFLISSRKNASMKYNWVDHMKKLHRENKFNFHLNFYIDFIANNSIKILLKPSKKTYWYS